MKDGVQVLHVKKKYTDAQMEKWKNTRVKPSQIDQIIDQDTDVFSEDGHLLLRFRKKALDLDKAHTFYDNVIQFARQPTYNRGSAAGSQSKNIYKNPKIMTNIIGFFDGFAPSQKRVLTRLGKKLLPVRATRFVMDYPDRYQHVIPYVENVDRLYAEYVPDKYRLQRKKADETPFRIGKTSFTTITTNVNFNTTMHTDKGDDEEGFGNLTVIERGSYTGGETCFPQYGLGVNVRTGDILFMDVHQLHGNLPMHKKSAEAERLSVVCYLRTKVWKLTRGKSRRFMETHNRTVKRLRKHA